MYVREGSSLVLRACFCRRFCLKMCASLLAPGDPEVLVLFSFVFSLACGLPSARTPALWIKHVWGGTHVRLFAEMEHT